jgi:hypothetical protein
MNRTQMQGDNASVSKGQKTAAPLMPAAINSPELEIKDAQLIFGAIWRELEEEFGRSRMRFPKELILLGGAPGAGKGTNSDFIRKVRGIDAPPIVVSQLLDTPEARAVKVRGGMVGDREVVNLRYRIHKKMPRVTDEDMVVFSVRRASLGCPQQRISRRKRQFSSKE